MREITTERKIGYAVSLAALAISSLLLILPESGTIWAVIAFAAIAALTFALIKKRSIRSYHTRWVTLIVAAFAALYLTVYYLSGLKFGFVMSPHGVISLSLIFKKILPLGAIVALSELTRWILLSEGGKIITPVSFLICVISDVVCAGGIPRINSAFSLVDFLGMTVFPALTANILYTYLSRRYGILPNTVFRLIITLYAYIIPIYSDVPKIFPAFVLLILPLGIYAFTSALFEKKKKLARKRESKWRFVAPAVGCVLMALFAMLVSCQFRFGILVIATGSMSGEIEKGDAIIYEAREHCEEIEENDVIVFRDSDRQTVHRVVKIETVNGQRRYITQGDANEGPDPGYRTDSDIVGVVRLKVLYIGHPSLWLKDIFTKQRGGSA